MLNMTTKVFNMQHIDHLLMFTRLKLFKYLTNIEYMNTACLQSCRKE